MTAAIVNDIIGHCACPLSSVDLFSDTISCDNKDHVIYRAGLSTSAQLDTEEILTILKEWTTQTSTLVVDGRSLQIDRSCTLVLSSFDDSTCDSTSANPPGAGSNSDVIPILAGIIGGIIIGGVLITVLVVILVIKCRGKTDKIRYVLPLSIFRCKYVCSFSCNTSYLCVLTGRVETHQRTLRLRDHKEDLQDAGDKPMKRQPTLRCSTIYRCAPPSLVQLIKLAYILMTTIMSTLKATMVALTFLLMSLPQMLDLYNHTMKLNYQHHLHLLPGVTAMITVNH